MKFTQTALKGAFVVDPEAKSDSRGSFSRIFCAEQFQVVGFTGSWVQINHSLTSVKGTVRGMHFQYSPRTEIKLVRCVRGVVWDVIVDVRCGSPTFLQWIAVELSAGNGRMIYIPKGFAHGFQTLVDDSELIYHHSEYYTPQVEGGVRYDDPKIGIKWPIPLTVISEKDQGRKFLDESFNGLFVE